MVADASAMTYVQLQATKNLTPLGENFHPYPITYILNKQVGNLVVKVKEGLGRHGRVMIKCMLKEKFIEM